jgi:hypothetical protein
MPFSCFALPDMFFVVPSAFGPVFMYYTLILIFDGPVFMFCTPGLIFGGTEGVKFRFHLLLARTHFRRYKGRPVPFSCFPRPNSFTAVPRASTPVFFFCVPGLVFGGTEVVRFSFHVLRSRTHFRWYRGRRAPFSCFALPDSFSAVPRAYGPVFMICNPGLVFRGTAGIGSRFHVLSS